MSESTYGDLFQAGTVALREARLAEAETAFDRALRLAQGLDRKLADRAVCNLAALRIVQGRMEGVEEDLSRVLGTSRDLKAQQLAAYSLASLHRGRNRPRIGRFFAEMSLDMARRLDDGFSQGATAHLLGILECSEGRMRQGSRRIEEALDAGFVQDTPAERTLVLTTLGYVQVLAGERERGARTLETGRVAVRSGATPLYESWMRLSLGFAALELGDLETAIQHSRRVLDLERARERRFPENHKYALYLLGEAYVQRGDTRAARECFHLLQTTYYPRLTELPELLLVVRTHTFLNWLT